MSAVPGLLAKRSETLDDPRPAETLAGHVALVGRVAARLVDDHGSAMLPSLGLDPGRWGTPLRQTAVPGALLGDLGKADDHVQASVRGDPTRQALHRGAAGPRLPAPRGAPARWWVDGVGPEVRHAAARAANGHHVRVRPGKAPQARRPRAVQRKLFVRYPATGPASEGFLDSVRPELETDAERVHGRAAVHVAAFLANENQEGAAAASDPARFRGLLPLGAKVAVSTVVTVPGLRRRHRTGMFAVPAPPNAAFAFGGVHPCGVRLSGTLLALLRDFRERPALLMTAPLRPERRAALRAPAARPAEPAVLHEPGTTVPVVREEDLPACLDPAGRVRPDALVRATISMLWGPVTREAATWRTVRGVLVAPRGRIDYATRWGAAWRR